MCSINNQDTPFPEENNIKDRIKETNVKYSFHDDKTCELNSLLHETVHVNRKRKKSNPAVGEV